MWWCTAVFYIYLPTWMTSELLLINRCDHTQLGFVVATVIIDTWAHGSKWPDGGVGQVGGGGRRAARNPARRGQTRTVRPPHSHPPHLPRHYPPNCHVSSPSIPATCHYPPNCNVITLPTRSSSTLATSLPFHPPSTSCLLTCRVRTPTTSRRQQASPRAATPDSIDSNL